MAFINRDRKEQNTGRAESPYLKLAAGERLVRILDTEPMEFWRYWLSGPPFTGLGKGRSITMGRNDPIREYMLALGEEDPNFRRPSCRYLLNVLDRTPVKLTSKGVAVYADEKGVFPSKSPDGEDISLAVIAPHNKVLVIEFGNELGEAFEMIHEKIKDPATGEALPIWKFDVNIITRGTGTNTKRMAMPGEDRSPLPDVLFALDKYDLSEFARPMPHEYQVRILNGEDYGTIIKELGWKTPTPCVPQF